MGCGPHSESRLRLKPRQEHASGRGHCGHPSPNCAIYEKVARVIRDEALRFANWTAKPVLRRNTPQLLPFSLVSFCSRCQELYCTIHVDVELGSLGQNVSLTPFYGLSLFSNIVEVTVG